MLNEIKLAFMVQMGLFAVVSPFSWLIAQVDAERATDILSTFGVLSVLVWYLAYNTKVTIPGIQRTNHDLVKAIVSDHKETVKDLTDRFDINLREERDARRKELIEERNLRQLELRQMTEALNRIPPPPKDREGH